VEDVHNLAYGAWAIVRLSDKDVAAYKIALDKAKKASALMPNDPIPMCWVGSVRTGSYEEAMKRSQEVRNRRAMKRIRGVCRSWQ